VDLDRHHPIHMTLLQIFKIAREKELDLVEVESKWQLLDLLLQVIKIKIQGLEIIS